MKIVNKTPFRFAPVMGRLHPGRFTATWVVKATLILRNGETASPADPGDQEHPTGDAYFGDDLEGECSYGSDFDAYKPHADLLLKGTCHVPGGRPLAVCRVVFGVGRWSKTLAVIGARAWKTGLLGSTFTDPSPFLKVPLTWSNAFGGNGHKVNPVGRGFRGGVLPNVEYADRLVRDKSDNPEPAGFGPVNRRWPRRVAKMGTYNRKWANTRWPALPGDLDWTYFNAAPPDQQLEGFLNGDETLRFENLHPEIPRFTSRLPGIRVRLFVRDVRGDERPVREIPMKLDTLTADTDEGKVYLVWRGLGDVMDDEFLDVDAALVVSEKVENAPAPKESYIPMMDESPEEVEPIPLEEPPDPEKIREKIKSDVAAFQKVIDKHLAAGEKVRAASAPKLGELGKVRIPTARDAAGPAVNLAALMSMPPMTKLQAKRELIQGLRQAKASHERMVKGAEAIKGAGDGLLKKVEGMAVKQGNPPMKIPSLPDEAKGLFAKGGAIDKVLAKAGLGGALDTPQGPSRVECAEMIARGIPLAGKDLTGADFSGLVLDGLDLEGAKIDGAIFVDASLKKTRLTGIEAEGPDFTRADLTGADLSGSRFREAVFMGALLAEGSLKKTVFVKSVLQDCDLGRIEGPEADFKDCAFTGALFTGAVLPRASFRDADLTGVDLSAGDLRKTVFTGAMLNDAVLDEADLKGADLGCAFLNGASCKKGRLGDTSWKDASGMEADFSGSDFKGADLTGASFHKAVLDGADLTGVEMGGASFMGSSFDGAVLKQVRGEKAVLSRGKLAGVDCTASCFKGADFTGADVSGADFSGADLREASMLSVSGAAVIMDGAKLERFSGGQGADFSKGRFNGVEARDSSWMGSGLDEAVFRGSNLTRANLHRASAKKADFRECILVRASLRKGEFSGANFAKANLFQGRLAQAVMTGANLDKTSLFQADMLETRAGKDVLKKADTTGAIIRLHDDAP